MNAILLFNQFIFNVLYRISSFLFQILAPEPARAAGVKRGVTGEGAIMTTPAAGQLKKGAQASRLNIFIENKRVTYESSQGDSQDLQALAKT